MGLTSTFNRTSSSLSAATGSASPAAATPGSTRILGVVNNATTAVTGDVGNALEGRVSLGVIVGGIVLIVGFYWWTRGAQGGG